jgi:hypothetical protein
MEEIQPNTASSTHPQVKKARTRSQRRAIEEITEEEYNKSVAKLDFSIPLQQNSSDLMIDMDDCATGACPIR